ncbi:MAG: hypothetical protein AVDCRST_MAG42-512, partial [uncultured Chthoniobacterales bacterium]
GSLLVRLIWLACDSHSAGAFRTRSASEAAHACQNRGAL